MKEKIKNFLYGFGGVGFIILIIGAFILLIGGGVKLFETFYPILQKIDTVIWGIVWSLLLLSIIPVLRKFTGNGIVIGTYIGGAIFWLLSFYITYSLWGFLGIFIGVLFMGFGVFFTAILALIFDGQFMGALGFAFVLVQIYLLRILGHWILTKYRSNEGLKKETHQKLEFSEVENQGTILEEKIFYCSKCGNKLESQSKFCGNCGTNISK